MPEGFRAPRIDPGPAIAALSARFGKALSTNATIRDQHGHDESWHPTAPPDAVLFAETTEDVAQAVRLCAAYGLPVVPFGTGTSLEGGPQALHGGLCIDLSRMNRILRVDTEDMDCTVEAGVTRMQLNTHLRDTGLFFPIDPGADASIGGMAATRASGTNAVRYGTMREAVLGLNAVLADGSIVHTGGRARKSAAGYDLTRLLVGSEGTLGIITEVTLRLHGVPEAMAAAVCPFPSLCSAVNTVIETIQMGVPMARIELLDDVQIDAVNRYAKSDYAVAPTLFLEFHGSETGIREQAETVAGIAGNHGGAAFQWATAPEDRRRLWQARHDALYACLGLRPNCRPWPTDVCVPISRLADCILETKADLAGTPIPGPIVGHVGDGNFHVCFVLDPNDPAEVAEVRRLSDRLVRRALAMGGTCTGEHGIGCGKIEYLQDEHHDGLLVMQSIKRALDPNNLLNPGKVLTVLPANP